MGEFRGGKGAPGRGGNPSGQEWIILWGPLLEEGGSPTKYSMLPHPGLPPLVLLSTVDSNTLSLVSAFDPQYWSFVQLLGGVSLVVFDSPMPTI